MTTKNLSPGKRTAGEVRLERLYEATFFLGLKITLDGGGTCEAMDCPGSVSPSGLFKIKNRPKGLYLGTKRWERSKLYPRPFIQERD